MIKFAPKTRRSAELIRYNTRLCTEGRDVISVLRNHRTLSGAHPVSYPVDTGDSFSGEKRPDTSIFVEVKKCIFPFFHASLETGKGKIRLFLKPDPWKANVTYVCSFKD